MVVGVSMMIVIKVKNGNDHIKDLRHLFSDYVLKTSFCKPKEIHKTIIT